MLKVTVFVCFCLPWTALCADVNDTEVADTRILPSNNQTQSKSLLDVLTTVYLGFNPNRPIVVPSSCRYWCRSHRARYYCCDHGVVNVPTFPTIVRPSPRPGCCPPVRPECPGTRLGPPVSCVIDSQCDNGIDKCCYDTCLRQDVCKPPQPCYPFNYVTI